MKSVNEEINNVLVVHLAQRREEINEMLQPVIEQVIAPFFESLQVRDVDLDLLRP